MSQGKAWEFINDCTKDSGPGHKFETTLLGFVRGEWRDGVLVGTIPGCFKAEARTNGFRVIHASVKDGDKRRPQGVRFERRVGRFGARLENWKCKTY